MKHSTIRVYVVSSQLYTVCLFVNIVLTFFFYFLLTLYSTLVSNSCRLINSKTPIADQEFVELRNQLRRLTMKTHILQEYKRQFVVI
jgi:hypothetical protein